MKMTKLYIGSVLSYRGGAECGKWKVSALIAVSNCGQFPVMQVDGKLTCTPKILLEHGGKAYLRYDLSTCQQAEEGKVEYRIDGIDEV